MKHITGDTKMLNVIQSLSGTTAEKAVEAVEKTCVDIANHAKDGHAGNMAHASSRYRNRTTNLTNCIVPDLVEVNKNTVHGTVTASEEYAAAVELGMSPNPRTGLPNKAYPYMVPALIVNKDNFGNRMSKILK